MAYKVSIVIRALNEAEHLPALFEGIQSQSRQPDEVILVDSGSTDNTKSLSASYGASIVEISPAEFTFGRSLNIGCQAATGDLLVFASAHVYPLDPYWLENLTSPFEQDSSLGLVYGRQMGDERSSFSEAEIMRRWFPLQRNTNQDHPFCNNANCAVRKSIWKENPYDESITGLEDMAWAKQVLNLGYRVWYEPDAAIVHIHEESISQVTHRYRREAIAHKMIFGHQKLGMFEAIGLFVANVIRDYLAAIPRKKLLRNIFTIPKFRFAQFRGAWLGFRQHQDPTAELKRRFYYPKGINLKGNLKLLD